MVDVLEIRSMYHKYLPAARHADCKMNINRENTAADDDVHIESNAVGISITTIKFYFGIIISSFFLNFFGALKQII
jgi:hypothetical protein